MPEQFFFGLLNRIPKSNCHRSLLKDVSDKVLHAVEYGILSVLCRRAFRWAAGPAVARQAVVSAIVAASAYGVTDEVHQFFVPFRESGWIGWPIRQAQP